MADGSSRSVINKTLADQMDSSSTVNVGVDVDGGIDVDVGSGAVEMASNNDCSLDELSQQQQEESTSRRASLNHSKVEKAKTERENTITGMFLRMEAKAHEKIFKGRYTKRECTYVFLVGVIGSFNYGFINGACMSGLLSSSGKSASVGGLSGHFTNSSLDLAKGDFQNFGYFSCMILSYMMGSFLVGVVCHTATPYQLNPKYGPIFMLGGAFLCGASLIAAMDIYDTKYAFYLAGAANGMQNGMASLYSANLIRCSMTGASIDVALLFGKILRGNRRGIWKLVVLITILFNFCLGGLVSFWATSQFMGRALLFNAALFLVIGISLVSFIVKELDVSVRAALLGTWIWKIAVTNLKISSDLFDKQSGAKTSDDALLAIFDEIDDDSNGFIDIHELLLAFLKADPDITADEVKLLFQSVDTDGDGKLSRAEWAIMVKQKTKPKTLSSLQGMVVLDDI